MLFVNNKYFSYRMEVPFLNNFILYLKGSKKYITMKYLDNAVLRIYFTYY